MSEPLPAALRRERMLELIGRAGFARVAELSEAFQVSDVTVRTDLDALDAQQSIRRVHGGAVLRGSGTREPSFEEALASSADEKRRIGLAAAALVEPGSSVLLDVGTTTAAIARALADREDLEGVTVLTNGLTIALELERAIPRFQVIVTGGTLRPLQHSLVEPLAAVLLERVHADLAFIGCTGVHPLGGVTNVNLPEADLKRAMVGSATRAIAVADGGKLGRVHLGRIAAVDEFAGLITGETAGESAVAALRATGLAVTVV
ncbi:DeoR family transcriptional regulator [Leifsonia xyli subsp. cynodontis DSM 46306]|uniref:HTH deoR-type domain-containing protein n=1 Tax=Leifsonia xyli subsp. cynodontis DSM 46306 TaxID=1389489 RepID=U3P3B3_LEIXC|nr:DeoR/GlpR family DNA-binding transcription regulator [Leifsonia xyli]AGW40810.1 DeoR family transcriptional regulator [Leifsonia xyli subsp. cynodontis DSM 46306]